MIIYRPALHIFFSMNSWENLVLSQGSHPKKGNQVYATPSWGPWLTILGVDGAVPCCAPLPLWISQGRHTIVALLWEASRAPGQPEARLLVGLHPTLQLSRVRAAHACWPLWFISARRCNQNTSRESENVGKPPYFSIIIIHHKLTGDRGPTKIRSPISLLHARRPPVSLSPVFSSHWGQTCWLRNIFRTTAHKLRLTDNTQVFCLNSRPYSGTSSFYCIAVSSLTMKRMKMYTNHFN